MATSKAAGRKTNGSVLFEEDFRDGLELSGRFGLAPLGDGFADDGVVTRTDAGISVAPSARNANSGAPEFVKDLDGIHLKWLAVTTETFALRGQTRVDFRAGATVHGLDQQPYGADVLEGDADLRLGAATLNVLDFASGTVFDFWITNTAIYAFNERLRLPGQAGDFQTFCAIAPPVASEPGQMHDLAIIVDSRAGRTSWEVDGREIAHVDVLGTPQPGWDTIIDHGGTPEPSTPQSVVVGMGLMTLLDASLPPSARGLVDIGKGYTHPTEFRGGPTLFGQGVELNLEGLRVTRG